MYCKSETKINWILGLVFLFYSFTSTAQDPDSSAIVKDTSCINQKKVFWNSGQIAEIVIPAAMITYGVISLESPGLLNLDYSTRNELAEDNSLTNHHWDDYLQFAPAVAAFGLKLGGIESVHKTSDMFILYALSNVLETGIVYTTKKITYRDRPNDQGASSFPSGHTATAFVAAEFLNQEYGRKSVWISVGGYTMAALIGTSRVLNNKHWVSDVVAGAGIGILSTKIVYWTYPYLQNIFCKKNEHKQAFFCPGYENGNITMNIACTF